MANVLPQQSQKKLWRALRARFIIVLSVLLILLAILGYLALVPSQLALQFAAPPASAAAPTGAASPESTVAISRSQALLLAISPVLNASTTPASLIDEVVAPKPPDISIDHISYDATDDTVMLSGSGTRDAINAYRDLVAQNARFSSVSVPVSALVGESGHFSMTIMLAQH